MAERSVSACSVYVISDGHGNMKVGVAKHISNRIQTLQTGNAHPLQLLFEVQCFSPYKREAAWGCYQIERSMHLSAVNKRMTGEWFALEYHEALDELHSAVLQASDHVCFERYKISVSEILVHRQESEHVWYWPTSDVYERGIVQ